MSYSSVIASIVDRISQATVAVSELEIKQSGAERDLIAAEAALREATERYDVALGEGRDAAVLARQERAVAEVDLDIARRTIDTLARQVADAQEVVRVAGVEHKRAEADHLRGVFEETARQHLPQMSVGARAIIRAWAMAELAIEDARQAEGASDSKIPSAEEFRNSRATPRMEIERTRITRWVHLGTQDAIPDEINDRLIRQHGVVLHPNDAPFGMGDPISQAQGEFDRVVYVKAQASIPMPLLIESLCVPAIVGGQTPGWLPTEQLDPRSALALLSDLDRELSRECPEHETVDEFVRFIDRAAPADPI